MWYNYDIKNIFREMPKALVILTFFFFDNVLILIGKVISKWIVLGQSASFKIPCANVQNMSFIGE